MQQNLFKLAEQSRDRNRSIYDQIAGKTATNHIVDFCDVLAHLRNGASIQPNMVRAIFRDMVVDDAAALGQEFGSTYYLCGGAIFSKNTTTELQARDHMTTQVADPVMQELQGRFDQLPRNKWSTKDLSTIQDVAPLLKESIRKWRSIQLPSPDFTIKDNEQRQRAFKELVRVTDDHPVIGPEAEALLKVYQCSAQTYSEVKNTLSSEPISNKRAIGGRSRDYYHVYNPDKVSESEAAQMMSSFIGRAMLLNKQGKKALIVEENLKQYLISFALQY